MRVIHSREAAGNGARSMVVGTILSIVAGCGNSDGSNGSGTGGAGGVSAGGTSNGTGGVLTGNGGASAFGGAPAGGGASGSGGASGGGGPSGGASGRGSGGASGSGGTATGGTTGTGGASPTGDVAPMVALPAPAVARGASYRGFAERFNRYYTDAAWQPSSTIYVSPAGGGDGKTKVTPTTAPLGLAAATPGTRVFFVAGKYDGCFELASDQSGTYDAPILLYGERSSGTTRGAVINCCATGRSTCINLEAADYVAVDGFELVGGTYGVRAVGADYAATQHQKGVAVLDCEGHGQLRDPFFTGASDWYVIERSLGRDAGNNDGHGIYLSNGSDWNIARFNELRNNYSADFQINADPASTCTNIGIDVATPDCDALAGTPGDGGRGASDFMLVESNYFHDGLAQGANFTSVRHSIVRDNLFTKYAKHGVSFWQETTNPNLGSSDNQVLHNLFAAITANRQMLQFIVSSDRNHVENNVFVGVGSGMVAMEVDGTVSANEYVHNWYVNASLSGRSAGANEWVSAALDDSWFATAPSCTCGDPAGWKPSAMAPFLGKGALLPNALLDRDGKARTDPTDLGPYAQ